MNRLNVLYCADDGYAPFMGTSILSLFKNNTDIDQIKVYCVLDSVSEENVKKLNSLAKEYNRQIKIVDSGELNLVLSFVDIPKYRGSNVANYRIFLDLILDDTDERVLYLDSDTIVTGSLRPLLELDMKDKICAVVLDALASHYKRLIGFSKEDLYFNSGVMLFNFENWRKTGFLKQILHFIRDNRSRFCNPDQDLLNIVLKDKLMFLAPEFNFQPVHRVFSYGAYTLCYGNYKYYTKEQIEIAKSNPYILHTYRFLGDFPWHKGNTHPDIVEFDKYLRQSPWWDYVKVDKPYSLLFVVEKILYKILPKFLFLIFFAFAQQMEFRRNDNELKKISFMNDIKVSLSKD